MQQDKLNERLLQAASGGVEDDVRRLVAEGAWVGARDGSGNTPLHNAAFMGRRAVVVALLALGADADAENNDKNTPLHFATWDEGDEVGASCLARLISAGAEVNAANVAGYTPLHFAAKMNRKVMIETLLAAGANPLLRNVMDEIPRDLCEMIACHVPLLEAEIEWRDEKLPLRELRRRLRRFGALRPRNPSL